MKISDHDIMLSARRVRDAENKQLHVRPWRRSHFRVPSWLITVPAAAVAGFLIGFHVDREMPVVSSPLAQVVHDTVYIPISDSQRQEAMAVVTAVLHDTAQAMAGHRSPAVRSLPPQGKTMAQDGIDYSMLVMQ